MAKLFSAREIGVLALRKIGVVASQDTSADEGRLAIALQYLDLLLSEKAGTTRFWQLVPQAATFTYTADADSVDITSLMGSANVIDVFRAAYNDDTDDEIALLSREEWDLHKSGGLFPFKSSRALYIASDGDETYTAYMLPVPTLALTVRITGQKFSPTVTAATSSTSTSALAHGLDRSFQRWMVNALAVDIGDGPLARMPEDRLNSWRGVAQQSWARVNGYRGGGQRKQARFTRAWGG